MSAWRSTQPTKTTPARFEPKWWHIPGSSRCVLMLGRARLAWLCGVWQARRETKTSRLELGICRRFGLHHFRCYILRLFALPVKLSHSPRSRRNLAPKVSASIGTRRLPLRWLKLAWCYVFCFACQPRQAKLSQTGATSRPPKCASL